MGRHLRDKVKNPGLASTFDTVSCKSSADRHCSFILANQSGGYRHDAGYRLHQIMVPVGERYAYMMSTSLHDGYLARDDVYNAPR